MADIHHDWWDDDLLQGNMDGKWYCDRMSLENVSIEKLVKDIWTRASTTGLIPLQEICNAEGTEPHKIIP